MLKSVDQNVFHQTLNQGAAALQNNRAVEAERLARNALALAPRHPGALQLLGMTLLGQDRHGDAIAPLEDAVRISPNAPPETYLAMALRRSGRAAEAATILERAVERQPPFPHAFFELGTLLHSQHKLKEAAAILQRGLSIAPALASNFSLAIGNVYRDQGDAENARLAFERALASAPRLPPALQGLASVLMGSGEFAKAAERFQQVLALEPANVKARLLLVSCLLELGDTAKAITSLRLVLRESPQLLGQALKALAEVGRGRLYLKPSEAARFLGLDPPNAREPN